MASVVEGSAQALVGRRLVRLRTGLTQGKIVQYAHSTDTYEILFKDNDRLQLTLEQIVHGGIVQLCANTVPKFTSRNASKRKAKSQAQPGWGKLLKRGQRGPRDCWKRGSQIALHLLGKTLPLSQIPLPLDCPFSVAQRFFKQQQYRLQPLKVDAGPRYLLSQPDEVYLSRLSLRYGSQDEYHICVYYVNGTTRQLRDGGLRGTVYAVAPEDCTSKRKAQHALREFIGGQVSSVMPLEVYKCVC